MLRRFKLMMNIEDAEGETIEDFADLKLGDLEALQGVMKFPVRIKCATLAWNTMARGLDERDHPGHPGHTH